MYKRGWKRCLIGGATAFALAGVLFFFWCVPPLFDRLVNRTRLNRPYVVMPEAEALHQSLTVVDLHCDALISSRDLSVRANYGHVDLPRLTEGNVALQIFAIPTQTPVCAGVPWLPTDFDALTLLIAAQRWPRRAWTSTFERALYATERLHALEKRSEGTFRIVASTTQLEAYLRDRERAPTLTAGVLGVEGLHCLEGNLENLDTLYDAGVRIAGLAHLAGNDVGGAAHGGNRGGLTAFGEAVVRRMEEKRILIDLAHASPALIDDVLDIATRPVTVSHAGFTGVCDNERNLSDVHARRIAGQGGVIGVAYFPWTTGGRDVASITRALLYGVALVGVDHLALGSDFDGAVTTPFDASGVSLITDALLQADMSRDDIAKIMGENALRLLRETLPEN